MKRIRFKGARRKGTITPRRLWAPGEVVEVNDDEAETLLRDPDFHAVRGRRGGR